MFSLHTRRTDDRYRSAVPFDSPNRFALGAVVVLLLASGTLIWRSQGYLPLTWDEPRWTATGRYYFHKFFVERDFKNETWDDPALTRYGTRNPTVGKYLFGFAQALSGTGTQFTDRDRVLELWKNRPAPVDRSAIDAARNAVSVVGVAGVVLLYAIGVQLTGSISVGVIAALLYLWDPFVIKLSTEVMTDLPMMTLSLAWLWATLRAARRVRKGSICAAVRGGLVVGAFGAAAIGTKLNALMFAPISLLWGLSASLPARPDGRPTRGPMCATAISAIVAGLSLWVLLNPFLYSAPIANTKTLLSYGSELSTAAASSSGFAQMLGPTPDLGSRTGALLKFAAQGAFANLFDLSGVDAFLIVLGIALVLASLLGLTQTVPRRGAALLAIWTCITVGALLVWTPFAWGRYFLPADPCWALLQSVALVGVAKWLAHLVSRRSA